jgi:hypothetical protein
MTEEKTKGEIKREAFIIKSIQDMARQPRDWVGLAELREVLGLQGIRRPAQDESLRALSREKKIAIVPESNQKTITAADREAAIRIGGEDNHLVSIDRL